jgi:hypothetical protein
MWKEKIRVHDTSWSTNNGHWVGINTLNDSSYVVTVASVDKNASTYISQEIAVGKTKGKSAGLKIVDAETLVPLFNPLSRILQQKSLLSKESSFTETGQWWSVI